MMITDFLHATILGIVEGLTEFIPVSSTGHLILAETIFPLRHVHSETFSVFIQLGAILAVVCIYPRYFKSFLNPKEWMSRKSKVLFVAIFPALLSGLLFYSFIKKHLFSPLTVVLALFVGGLAMLFFQKKYPNHSATTHSIEDISYKQSFIVGLCQCASLWPGMSRSASTIVGGLIAKLDYSTAAEFSFLIAVPVMTAAVGFDLLKSFSELTLLDLKVMSLGFVVSFITAFFAIKTFISLLKRWQFNPFAFYRIVLAIVLGVVWLW